MESHSSCIILKTRYLFLIESLSISRGGPPRDVVSCARWLTKSNGHQVTIVTIFESEPRIDVPKEIIINYLKLNPQNPFNWLTAKFSLSSLIKDHDVTIVTGLWGPIDGLALRLANWHHRPIYIRTIGMLENYILKSSSWKKKCARKLYVDYNLRHANGLIVSTDLEKRQIQRIGFNGPFHLIPNGVDLDNFKLPLKQKARQRWRYDKSQVVLLFLGRIHPKKGLHLLLESLESLSNRSPHFSLLVAGAFGDKKYKKFILNLISQYRLGQSVYFAGQLDDQEKLSAFSAADIFILPSYSEGFSNSILEAMASSLPVLITDQCNFSEIETVGAGIVTKPDSSLIARHLREMIDSPDARQQMGSRGRRLIEERYDWKLLAKNLDDLMSVSSSSSLRRSLTEH